MGDLCHLLTVIVARKVAELLNSWFRLDVAVFAGQKSLYFDHFLLLRWRIDGFTCFRFHWIVPQLAHAKL